MSGPEPQGAATAVRTVALALGSNLGAREAFLAEARRRLAARLGPLAGASEIYETDPVGPPGQGPYLNQVVLVRSDAHPDALIETLSGIEDELGRRRGMRWGPRTIDIDLLLCDGEIWATERARVPHPELAGRPFVLVPLAELMPGWRDPRSGANVAEMLARCGRAGVRHWDG